MQRSAEEPSRLCSVARQGTTRPVCPGLRASMRCDERACWTALRAKPPRTGPGERVCRGIVSIGSSWRTRRAMRKKRALVLTGAGASLEFGAPCTADLTTNIRTRVLADNWIRHCGGDRAYLEIHETLARYLQGGACAVNFEHVYHCAHELLFTFEPTPGAVNEFRPILVPFVERRFAADQRALRALVDGMAKFICIELSVACDNPSRDLTPLAAFLARLRKDHITRIYTTNYDDFFLQAAPDLYTGFEPAPSSDPKSFDLARFWQSADDDCVFHVHGSVHLGFLRPPRPDSDSGTLFWFDDRAVALVHSSYGGSGERRMDGSQVPRTAVNTGLEKLSRLHQQPFSHYYASMARDALTASIIFVIGSGLVDLHLNACLADARRRTPRPPLVFVDYWRHGYLPTTAFDPDRKTTEMLHALRILVNDYYGGDKYGGGWIMAKDRTCAVWEQGFLAFLNAPDELDHVLAELV